MTFFLSYDSTTKKNQLKTALFLFLLCISQVLFSQKFTIEGHVQDQGSFGLEGATVFIQSAKDSAVLAYAITNKNGAFSVKVNSEEDEEILFNIGYIGFKPFRKLIPVPTSSESLILETVTLEEMVEELEVVTVISRAPPILMKKDTVEYNADSFKTLPNDKAEDLLKKLPGVEIDIDGNITFNGIEVQAVNVDGMEFFGEVTGDIALKNIPSNAISKVQVTDYKTNLQKFTGEESDSGTKEINFKIKKGKNTATFGDLSAGYGTDKKYQANANIFKLLDGKQLGVIGGANNINMAKGFNALPDTDTSNGYVESDFLGANFSKGKWNETNINSDYRYSSQSIENEQKSYRENFLPDFNYNSSTRSNSTSESENHQGNLGLKFIIPPKNKNSKNNTQVSNKTAFNSSNTISSSAKLTNSKYENGDNVSDYSIFKESQASNFKLNNEFNVTSKVSTNDYFNMGLATNFNKSTSESKEYSENILYQNNTSVIQDQIKDSENSGVNIGLHATWNAKLTPTFRIIPGYQANVNYSKNERIVNEFNESEEEYSDFNILQSAKSNYLTTTVKPILKLRYDYSAIRIELEGAYINTSRKLDDDLIDDRDFKAKFNYFTYAGRIRYRDKNGYKNVDFRYRQHVNLPSLSQLQPIEDVSDISHIIKGNPLLKPSIDHQLNLNYSNNLAYNNINISAFAKAEFTNNKIINATITNQDLIKNTTYENINGDYSLNGNTSLSKSYFNKKANFNMNFRFSAAFKNILSIQNEIKFALRNTTLKPSLSLKYSYDNKLDLEASYTYSLSKNSYDTDIFNSNKYFVQNFRFDVALFVIKNVFISNKIAYNYNSRVGDEFDGNSIFWNAGLGIELWDNKGTLSLIGYDVLGKNNGFRRIVSETYIQDLQNKILEQYFMVIFTYKFGSFAGQKMNMENNKFRRGRR